MTYVPRRAPILETVRLRDLDFQLYRWPGSDPDPIVLLHGWGDSGATWQFVVDALPQQRSLIAFDARGFGCTQWPQDGYWFPDYLADLEALLGHIAPDRPARLVGHSMGGNVALLYAGVRPDRIAQLVSLEGFGLPRSLPTDAPARYREWLDELAGGTRFAVYEDFTQFEVVLARRNPRTAPDHLAFIARSWGKQSADGRIELRADPRHKRTNPVLYQREQAEACWGQIAAPLLYVAGDRSDMARRMGSEVQPEHVQSIFRDVRTVTIPGAGHMMHHEQPAAVAELIETFFR
ncbi:alpha/beta hydrolase [Povalibacter sp.]|uniref:alpha/beta fold hydrolase n=1 Tax=Povalibacter sp. TaxID=1962978 RepID=UPI002F3F6E88